MIVMGNEPSSRQQIPASAVLLIPEPEGEPDHDIKPGYYDSKQLLQLLDSHKHNPTAIRFIADMLETGQPEDDGFVAMLRANCQNPEAIGRIVKIASS